MRLLVCIVSFDMTTNFLPNIIMLKRFMDQSGHTVDYAGISSNNDFHNYEQIIPFKYKFICTDRQLTKMCKFITTVKSTLNYDWYIKTRPEIRLLEQIDFSMMSPDSINARARMYEGPRQIKYGSSVPTKFPTYRSIAFNIHEVTVVLDDQIYIFSHGIITKGCFEKGNTVFQSVENEWCHTDYWTKKNIPLHIVGLNVIFNKYNDNPSLDIGRKRNLIYGLRKLNK